VVVVTVVGLLGSAFGTVSGVGGGGIFVPMLNLVVGFDTKSAAALSKCKPIELPLLLWCRADACVCLPVRSLTRALACSVWAQA
jgi:hypothetical protein